MLLACRKKTPGGKNAVHYQKKIGSRVVRAASGSPLCAGWPAAARACPCPREPVPAGLVQDDRASIAGRLGRGSPTVPRPAAAS